MAWSIVASRSVTLVPFSDPRSEIDKSFELATLIVVHRPSRCPSRVNYL